MKKLLLATAVAALSVSAAQAAPTVYGKVFVTADYFSGGDADATVTTTTYQNGVAGASVTTTEPVEGNDTFTLNSNGSRIGLRGGEPLTANTDLVYQLEYGVKIDDNLKGEQFKSRDTYLGLSNKQYGTVLVGRLTSIDDNINYVSQAVGQFDNSFGGAAWDGNRINNAIAYVSPTYNDFTAMAMYGNDADQEKDVDGLSDGGWGIGAKYEPAGQPFRAGATYIQSGDFNTVRVSGGYDINSQIGVGALYQMSDSGQDNSKTENVFSVSGTMKTATPWTTYAQADVISNVGYADGADSQQFVVGGKYGFNKATTGHVYAGYRNNEHKKEKVEKLEGLYKTGYVKTSEYEADGFGVGAGIEYKF